MAPVKQSPAEQQFVERLGQQAQADGISKIAGQIWATLILADEPLGSADLMALLHISKGSVSTSSRLLEMLGIIERRSKPGERQDYFAIQSNPYSTLVEGQIKRFENAQNIVAEAKSGITKPHAQANLADLERFYQLHRESSVALFNALKATPPATRK